jgi:hypothetical protein
MTVDEFISFYLDDYIPRLVRKACVKRGLEGKEVKEILTDRLVMTFAKCFTERGCDNRLMNNRLWRDLLNPISDREVILQANEERLPTLSEVDLDVMELENKGFGVSPKDALRAREILTESYKDLSDIRKERVDSRYGIGTGDFNIVRFEDASVATGVSRARIGQVLDEYYHPSVRYLARQTA